jgi:murein DD-endopeptidase MepM/ murein hydrolase activator NlpD
MRPAAGLVLVLALAVSAGAQSDDQAVRVVIGERTGNEIGVLLKSERLLEYTCTFSADFANMTASRPLPLTVDVRENGTVGLLSLRIADPGLAWHYHYDYHWKYGLRGGVPDPAAVYRLPYRPAERHVLIQGYRGAFSHQAGSINEYAYDFEMPVGTTVCAAREGVIIGVRDDSNAGGASPVFLKSANYVIIRHADGTYAEYLHLRQGGALVALGARVEAGQPVGLSGETGFTTRPHVHFAVFHLVDRVVGPERESVPVAVSTRAGVLGNLTQGSEY